MHAADLLRVWDQGQGLPHPRRALLLLGLAAPELAAAPERCTVGQRDAALIALRARIFGSRVESIAECPACHERVELDFDLAQVAVAPPADAAPTFELSYRGYHVAARLPTAADLAMIAPWGALAAERAALLRRCVLAASRNGATVPAQSLPDSVSSRVIAHMTAADQQADVRLALCCAVCSHLWETCFDIVSFLWSELNAWARRTLYDVHTLARAYGWGEAEILAMSPARRSFYLDLVRV
jgi:hypothetical protein